MSLDELFPDYSRVVITKRPSPRRLYALWLGLTVPLMHLPALFFWLALWPFLRGLYKTIFVVVRAAHAGITGRVLVLDEEVSK